MGVLMASYRSKIGRHWHGDDLFLVVVSEANSLRLHKNYKWGLYLY